MGLRKAVDEHCRSCIYDKHAGGSWRQQVANCTIFRCSLWAYRPKPLGTRVIEIGLGLPKIRQKKEAIA